MARSPRYPRADQAIYQRLAQAFRDGDIWSFSFENGRWTTWTWQEDWDATERSGKVRRPELVAQGYGPHDWERSDLLAAFGLDTPAPKRVSKAQLVAQLRAVPNLPAAALALLDAA
jgi:hypothetical protein